MRIAVLGGTGRTGSMLVDELLTRGHHLTLLARDPTKVTQAGVTVVVGDSRHVPKIEQVVTGADAVVSALGPTDFDRTLHRDTAPLLVAAMERAGVKRYVGISVAGMDLPDDRKRPRDKVVSWLMNRFGGEIVKDKGFEYEALNSSDLEWTLVRPPRLKNGKATGRVQHSAHRSAKSTTITRGDLASFVADVVESDDYVRQAPLIATAKK